MPGKIIKRSLNRPYQKASPFPKNVLKDYPELNPAEAQKPGKQKINEEFGKASYELLKNYLKSNKEEDIDYDRLIQTTRNIIKKDNLKNDDVVAAVSEALLYENGHAENWNDLRNAIKEGGYETNKSATERKIEVGVKLPADIMEIANGKGKNTEIITPLENAVNNAANKPAPKPADNYGANNTLVTKDRYEELKKRMKDKLNNLNVGFDPELLAMGTEMAAYHVEAGARKFVDFSKRMIGDLGDAIRPYLKAIYNGASDMPGMEELSKDMDDSATVRAIDVNGISTEEAPQPKQEEIPVPDPAKPLSVLVTGGRGAMLKTPQDKFIDSITDRLDNGVKIKNTPALVALATDAGMEQGKDYQDIKELYDTAGLVLNKYIADRGDRFSPENKTVGQAERIIRELDELSDLLPTETQRSATQVELQQYSTPLSFAFLVNWIAGVNSLDTVLEPSAGEGNIAVFAKAAGAKVIANEWDSNRGDLLKKLGFYKVTKEDAKFLHATPSLKDEKVTTVVMNPPFSKDVALGGRMDLHAAEKTH